MWTPFFSHAIPTYRVLPIYICNICIYMYLSVTLSRARGGGGGEGEPRVQNGDSDSYMDAVFELLAQKEAEIWTSLLHRFIK